MTRAIAVVLLGLVAAAPGCTLVFGAAGGGLASHHNRQDEAARARRGAPAVSPSVMPAVLAGAGAGMIVDALVIGFLLRGVRDAEPVLLATPGLEN